MLLQIYPQMPRSVPSLVPTFPQMRHISAAVNLPSETACMIGLLRIETDSTFNQQNPNQLVGPMIHQPLDLHCKCFKVQTISWPFH
jgi:hypothetical protein